MCRKTHDCWVSLMDIKAEHINEMRNAVEGPGEQIPTRFLQHNTNHNAYRLVGTAGRTMPRWGVAYLSQQKEESSKSCNVRMMALWQADRRDLSQLTPTVQSSQQQGLGLWRG
jgi:hypothetical protein